MMYGLVLVVHVLVALFLIAVILLQGGRGGLGEALGGAAAQSLFGGGANTVMTKITTVMASLFMVTCLSLAVLSTARGRSIMDQFPASVDSLPAGLPAGIPTPPVDGPIIPTPTLPSTVGPEEPAPAAPVTAIPAAPTSEATPTSPAAN